LFLKAYIKELTKEYKWVVKTTEGKLINMPACGHFDAVGKIAELTDRISREEPDYICPPIAEERFIIRKAEYFKINSITTNKTE
jgi:hypothetical protein